MLYVKPSGGKSWVLGVQVYGRLSDIGLGSVSRYDELPELDEVPLLERRVLLDEWGAFAGTALE